MIVSLKFFSVWAYVFGRIVGACWVLWSRTSSSIPPPLPMRSGTVARTAARACLLNGERMVGDDRWHVTDVGVE